jgi:ATP-dependent exoDNAse (exonuclease V) beta subunit
MPEPWQVLWTKNSHPRDQHIRFFEPTHTYYIKGSSDRVISCTGFLHHFFPHFNPKATIQKMMKSPKWPQSKYYGMTAEEIEKTWSDSGKEASSLGTAMHLAIEQFLNGAADVIDPEVQKTQEWEYFQNFWHDCGHDLEPYRMEWEVWSEEHLLCGSIDGVFRRKSDGKIVIYDWKRSKEIKTANDFETGYAPVDHLPNTNYWHYTLQLNTYRWFLETLYGLDVGDMYLVILHPNNRNYRRIRLNRLDQEVLDMLDCRKRALLSGINQPILLPLPSCMMDD